MSIDFDRFKSELYRRVYDQLDIVLPEFNFKKGYKGEWVSGNKLKVSGDEGSSLGKVYCYPDNPYCLIDYRSGSPAITTYLQNKGKASTWFEAIQYLSEKVGLDIPREELSSEKLVELEETYLKAKIFEAANSIFMGRLFDEQDERAISHAKYLLEDRRYERVLREDSRIELGFIPSLQEIRTILVNNGYKEEDVKKCFPHQNYVGTKNCLTIPYRDHQGNIQGFAYRDIKHTKDNQNSKYIYTMGLKRSDFLLGLKRQREIVLVEGLIDALFCQAIELRNVVALGGTSLNENQVKLALSLGVERITLCLDNDEAGQKATDAAIDLILKVDKDIKLYVASLPEGYKDPDELLRDDKITAFLSSIDNAHTHLKYSLTKRLNSALKSSKISECLDPISDIEREKLITDAIRIGSRAKGDLELELYKTDLNKILTPYGITQATMGDVLGKAQAEREREKARVEIEKKLAQAQSHIKDGEVERAYDIICGLSKQNNLLAPDGSYSSLLKPITENEVADKLRNKPDSIDTGYVLKKDKDEEKLLLPSGAITILAAPTNHGKTTLLINLALNVSQRADQKPAYLFSYEEDREAILLKTLNTYANIELSANNRRSIISYFKTGETGYFARGTEETFKNKKDSFFKDLVDTGKLSIHYTDYTVEDLVGAIKYLKSQDAIGSVFVDYMQLLKVKNYRGNSRVEELKEICLKLKDCAVETGLPIVLGAQFNREVINTDKIHATNIGEAGDIERIANLIIGFWNRTKPELNNKDEDLGRVLFPKIFATVLKSRDSATGAKADFLFDGNTGKIENGNKNEPESQLSSVKLPTKIKKAKKDFTPTEED
jgi:DNA primase catalytic core